MLAPFPRCLWPLLRLCQPPIEQGAGRNRAKARKAWWAMVLGAYLWPHVPLDPAAGHLRLAAHRGTQCLGPGARARRRDDAVRLWRGNAAADDALRGVLLP